MEKTTIDFLKNLKINNNKVWFEENRKNYELAKADMEQLVQQVIAGLTAIDIRYGELTAKQCMFRINRDVRFSKDKSPYKTNLGAGFSIGGKKSSGAGFYLHIEPGRSFIGGGLWMPAADALKKIRQEIDYQAKDFLQIIENNNFVKCFSGLSEEDILKNAPKGYENDHPMLRFLRLKSFVATHSLTDSEVLDKNNLQTVMENATSLAPLIAFINKAMEE